MAGVVPDVITYNSKISACAKDEQWKPALSKVLADMGAAEQMASQELFKTVHLLAQQRTRPSPLPTPRH